MATPLFLMISLQAPPASMATLLFLMISLQAPLHQDQIMTLPQMNILAMKQTMNTWVRSWVRANKRTQILCKTGTNLRRGEYFFGGWPEGHDQEREGNDSKKRKGLLSMQTARQTIIRWHDVSIRTIHNHRGYEATKSSLTHPQKWSHEYIRICFRSKG